MPEFLTVYHPWWDEGREREKQLRKEAEAADTGYYEKIPFVTCLLVAINTVIFFMYGTSKDYSNLLHMWGFTPKNIQQLSSLPTFITYMFLHGDIFHLFFNMIILLQFGYFSENRIGRYKFLTLYLASGVFAALFHLFFNLNSEITCIGASGAVFGILANYALLYPVRPIYVLGYAKMPSIFVIFLVFLLETLYAFVGINPYIGHIAHIGGGIAGVIFTALIFPKQAYKTLLMLIDAMIPTVPEAKPIDEG